MKEMEYEVKDLWLLFVLRGSKLFVAAMAKMLYHLDAKQDEGSFLVFDEPELSTADIISLLLAADHTHGSKVRCHNLDTHCHADTLCMLPY